MPPSSIAPRAALTAVRPKRTRHRRALRWVIALVAALALHGLTMRWFGQYGMNALTPPARAPVQIMLLKPERVELTAANQAMPALPHAAPSAREAHEAHPSGALAARMAPRHGYHPPAAPAQSATNATPDATASASAPNVASGAAAGNTTSANGHTTATAKPPASHGVKFSVPPSGDLQYDTFYNGVQNAPGTIHWSFDGQHYDMSLSVGVPFVGRFGWESRGHVDAFGLAPEQYIERRSHRPANVTVFNRADKQIAFTRTGATLALPDGAQDRLGVIMQLVSLVRGNPEAYRAGVTREFYVADNDSGETWPVMTMGDEIVQTSRGFVNARHFMRMPRHAGDKRRIDVWLAPSLGWLPVRLIQTESGGTQMELVWRGPIKLTETDTATKTNTATQDHADNTRGNGVPASDATVGSAPASASAP